MKRTVTIGVILVFSIILGLLVYNMAAKNSDKKQALERQGDIVGSWTFDGHTFLSVDNSNGFTIVKNNQEIKRGTVKKTGENYYLLYSRDTNDLCAKIIPSYEKLYLIRKDLEITEFEFFSDALVEDPENIEK